MIRCKTILGGHKVGVFPHIGGEQSDFYPDFRILQNAQSIKKCAVHHLGSGRRGRVNPTRNENRPNLYRFGSVLGSV